MASISTRDAILDFAETSIRRGGFDAVSFRTIAAAVGVKSASVHYHFPQKADLGCAVVARYAERFVAGLGSPDNPTEGPRTRIERLTSSYRRALQNDGAACLCAVLGATVHDVPPLVRGEISKFYKALLAWTRTALADTPTAMSAELMIAALVGAMILAIEQDDPRVLVDAETTILNSIRA